jgi:hypothetical protein
MIRIPGPYAYCNNFSCLALLGQQISINLLVAVLKKDRFPTVPALRNVMRKASNHRTRHSCHGENYHERRNRG